jgi:GWxTD domain-containing protein
MLPIDDLPSGQYSLTVRVVDDQSQTIAETSGRFNIQWPVFALKDQKYDVLLEQLRVIASREELQKLSRLDEADRQRGLFEFWQQRDPTPGTPQNEALDEFYRRVRYASRHFRWIGGEGWKSPQGQIYLMHGQPDEIRRYKSAAVFRASEGWTLPRRGWPSNHPEEFPSPALVRTAFPYDNTVYEVWEYDQLNRRFVFVDTRGTGIYELIDPLSFDNPWSR